MSLHLNLSDIHAGWVTLSIDDFSEIVSYTYNVPIILMNRLTAALKNGFPTTLPFDCEGYEFLLIVDSYEAYIIFEKEQPELFHFEIDAETILLDVYNNLINNAQDWITFNSDYIPDLEPNSFVSCKVEFIKAFDSFSQALLDAKYISYDDMVQNINAMYSLEDKA